MEPVADIEIIDRLMKLPASPLARIHTPTGCQIVQQMIFATLQIPTFGLPWPASLRKPKVDQGFLEEILTQGQIGSRSPYHANQGFPGRQFINKHIAITLGLTHWRPNLYAFSEEKVQ